MTRNTNSKENSGSVVDKEATTLLAYGKAEAKMTPRKIVLMLNDMVDGKENFEAKYWNWKLAKYIEQATSAISVIEDIDADVEVGDWGLPIVTGGGAIPHGYTIDNREYFVTLAESVTDIVNKIPSSIKKFLAKHNSPRWLCCDCNLFMGNDLNSYDTIKKLLSEFDARKYRKCRYCAALNYFEISRVGDINFKVQNLDIQKK